MITDETAEKANDYIRDNSVHYAKAKAERIYLEQFRKSKKALLIQQAPPGTVQDKESYAYAHKEYQELLTGLRVAVEIEETLRWEMVAAQTKIDIYRTQQANTRKGY
ncbi:MAG: hypothetical protein GTN99_09150 [Candidatus Dadabacteria bacterium]|nr:hypothetical protein [Candidatus Dadabacteria bacterium]